MVNYNKNYIRQAQTFAVNICGLMIPKNAVYGRQENTYFYVNNFEQFIEKRDKYEIYLLTPQSKYFRKVCMVYKNPIMRAMLSYVKEHELYDVKCENHFGIKLDRLFKEESRGNNAVNSYKTVHGQYYSSSWFKRT